MKTRQVMLNGSVGGNWESEGHQGFSGCSWQALLVGILFSLIALQLHCELRTSLIHSVKLMKDLVLSTADHVSTFSHLTAFAQAVSSAWIYLSAFSEQLPIIHT